MTSAPLPRNLLTNLPLSLPQEWTQTLAESSHVRIERIVSTGHASPDDFWYDQQDHEWILILQGEAKLQLEDQPVPIHLGAGDQLLIPARQKHRVAWTTPAEPTVWLAVFFTNDE